jgi:hypothetical protein
MFLDKTTREIALSSGWADPQAINQENRMERNEIRAVLEDLWPGFFGEKIMALSVCELSAPAGISREELIEKANKIWFDFQASSNFDDDMYWYAQSPFNGHWFLFASQGSYPKKPASFGPNFPHQIEKS